MSRYLFIIFFQEGMDSAVAARPFSGAVFRTLREKHNTFMHFLQALQARQQQRREEERQAELQAELEHREAQQAELQRKKELEQRERQLREAELKGYLKYSPKYKDIETRNHNETFDLATISKLGTRGAVLHHSAETVLCFRIPVFSFFFSQSQQTTCLWCRTGPVYLEQYSC